MSIAVLFSRYPASASVGDPSATRTVYISVILLVVLGVALAALAFWVIRRTRPEPQLLAPLEEMDTRAWRKQDPAAQRRTLDASRPVGALPVRPEVAEPVVDSEFAAERPVVGFDDLVDEASLDEERAAEAPAEEGLDAAEPVEEAADAAETALVTTPEPIETNSDTEASGGPPDDELAYEGVSHDQVGDDDVLTASESDEDGSESDEDGSASEIPDDGSASEVNDDRSPAGEHDHDADRSSIEADDGLLPGSHSS